MKPVLFLIVLISVTAVADVPPQQRAEVEHLISFIRNTECRLVRNNKSYTGEQAIEHILRKYDYYRDEIQSTEDFIAYSASKSVISGKPYVAYCEGLQPVTGSEWLLTELKHYRKTVQQ